MKNTKILSIAVILLLITNLVLVAFMVMDKKKQTGKKPGGPQTEASEVMVKTLNMTDAQQQQYKELKETHFKNIKPYIDSLKSAKAAFFELARRADFNDSLVAVLGDKVCERQADLDRLTLHHFRDVRKIFTAEQLPKFDSLVRRRMAGRGKMDSSGKK